MVLAEVTFRCPHVCPGHAQLYCIIVLITGNQMGRVRRAVAVRHLFIFSLPSLSSFIYLLSSHSHLPAFPFLSSLLLLGICVQAAQRISCLSALKFSSCVSTSPHSTKLTPAASSVNLVAKHHDVMCSAAATSGSILSLVLLPEEKSAFISPIPLIPVRAKVHL